MFTVANSQLSLSELIGITVSELFGISRLRGRTFTREEPKRSATNVCQISPKEFGEIIPKVSPLYHGISAIPKEDHSNGCPDSQALSPTLPYLPQSNPRIDNKSRVGSLPSSRFADHSFSQSPGAREEVFVGRDGQEFNVKPTSKIAGYCRRLKLILGYPILFIDLSSSTIRAAPADNRFASLIASSIVPDCRALMKSCEASLIPVQRPVMSSISCWLYVIMVGFG
jgi:hypothetical protein